TARALPPKPAAQRGPFWMPIGGPNSTPIDSVAVAARVRRSLVAIDSTVLVSGAMHSGQLAEVGSIDRGRAQALRHHVGGDDVQAIGGQDRTRLGPEPVRLHGARRCRPLRAFFGAQLRRWLRPLNATAPLTARLSQYPLRSESDQSAALPRIDAMHRNK